MLSSKLIQIKINTIIQIIVDKELYCFIISIFVIWVTLMSELFDYKKLDGGLGRADWMPFGMIEFIRFEQFIE